VPINAARAEDITFYVGDLLYDDTLQDVGILLECFDSHREYEGQPDSNVIVWRTWWCRAGEEEYSEFGLQSLVAMEVFTCYSINTCDMRVI
jgi:hypothetical protein